MARIKIKSDGINYTAEITQDDGSLIAILDLGEGKEAMESIRKILEFGKANGAKLGPVNN